jgi:hypothetical protein
MRLICHTSTAVIGTEGGGRAEFPPGTPFEIPDDEARSLIERGRAVAADGQAPPAEPGISVTAPPTEPPPAPPSDDDEEAGDDDIDAALAIIDQLPDESFTKDGKPTVAALSDNLGKHVSTAWRDKVHELWVDQADDAEE